MLNPQGVFLERKYSNLRSWRGEYPYELEILLK